MENQDKDKWMDGETRLWLLQKNERERKIKEKRDLMELHIRCEQNKIKKDGTANR